MKRFYSLLILVASMFSLASCSSLIFEYEGDCSVTYKLRFRYDRNMKWADAFSNEVKSVRVYIFDQNERLVRTIVESGDALASPDYAIVLPLTPGDYHLVAWCGADNNPGDECFDLSPVVTKSDVPTLSDVRCALKTKTDAQGTTYSDRLLHPLFHGEMDLHLDDYSLDGGEYSYTMRLTKDTNDIRVILQQLSGVSLNVDDFTFRITDDNSLMDRSNNIIPNGNVEYRQWHSDSVEANVEIRDPYTGTYSSGVSTVALAEISIPRMMLSHRNSSYLEIHRKTDDCIIARIPLIDYALLIKGYERQGLGDQEYLDRQDEFAFTFFLDAYGKWISSSILINSWRVVFQNQDLGN